MKFSILVLHNLGDPLSWRQTMVEKELCLPLFAPEHNYVIHDSELPLPQYVKDIKFDAIILTQTFLSKRSDPSRFLNTRNNYDFIKESNAFKIALPQDDYTCCDILDNWMMDWNIDLVYTVCHNDWEILYKNYHSTGRLIQGYTGYISNDLINRGSIVKPLLARTIDVSYRASSLSPVFGMLGKIKTEIGNRFEAAAYGYNLNLDLSTKSSKTITGLDWYDFIENSKSMIGVNSGSSLLDPLGLINIKVHKFMMLNPKASYEEIESECFAHLDGEYVFTAISPRNIECAILNTAQILTPGQYSDFIQPWEHYLPIEPDMSNFSEVLSILKNKEHLERLIKCCKDAILSFSVLRYENHVSDLLKQIASGSKLTNCQRDSSKSLILKYRSEVGEKKDHYWVKKRLKLKLKKVLINTGARKIKYYLINTFAK